MARLCGSTASTGAMQAGGQCIGLSLPPASLTQALRSPFMLASAILPMPVWTGMATLLSPTILADMALAWAADRLNPAARKSASSITKRCFGESPTIIGLG